VREGDEGGVKVWGGEEGEDDGSFCFDGKRTDSSAGIERSTHPSRRKKRRMRRSLLRGAAPEKEACARGAGV